MFKLVSQAWHDFQLPPSPLAPNHAFKLIVFSKFKLTTLFIFVQIRDTIPPWNRLMGIFNWKLQAINPSKKNQLFVEALRFELSAEPLAAVQRFIQKCLEPPPVTVEDPTPEVRGLKRWGFPEIIFLGNGDVLTSFPWRCSFYKVTHFFLKVCQNILVLFCGQNLSFESKRKTVHVFFFKKFPAVGSTGESHVARWNSSLKTWRCRTEYLKVHEPRGWNKDLF